MPNLDEILFKGRQKLFCCFVAFFASKSGLLMRPPSGVFAVPSENLAGGADTLAPAPAV